jgi:photoactive yellow protein
MRECSANTAMRMSMRAGCAGRKDMGVSDRELPIIPFGLFELNAAGVVVHYSPPTEDKTEAATHRIVGRDFFADLAALTEVGELKDRFHKFMADGAAVERFSLSFPYRQGSIKVQIVMAHLTEKSERGRERFALVRLMPEKPVASSSLADA